MGIAEIGFYFLFEIQASFFQAYRFFKISDFKKNFFLNSDFCYHRKIYRLFLVYPFLGGGGILLLKVQKECADVIVLKSHWYQCVFRFEKGYKRIRVLHWVAPKHTAYILLNFLWLLIFYLYILTIFHCEIRPFLIFINVGPVCIDYITNFFINNLVAKGFGFG